MVTARRMPVEVMVNEDRDKTHYCLRGKAYRVVTRVTGLKAYWMMTLDL